MVWRFLKQYGMSKATDLLDDFAATVVAFDPEVASRAQIEMMDAELQKLGRRLAEAEAEVAREHRETAALRQTYDEYLRAAHILQAKLTSEDAVDRQGEIEASLARVVGKLEHLKPEVEREEQEDQEVEAWRCELRRSFEDLGKKLHQAKGELQSARREMDVARLRKDRAAEQDRRAQEAAGMTSSISTLSVALDAMNQTTASLRAETETLQLKAGLFQAEQLDYDPQIAAALETVRGKERHSSTSLADRLAALGNRGGGTPLSAA